jgi:ketosteroid isomerase-like protein
MRRVISLCGALVIVAVAVTAAQGPAPAAPAAPEKLSADAEAVLELDRQAETALNRADVDFLSKVFADDMIFTHGEAWTKGNTKGNTNTKEVWLNSIKNTAGMYADKNANLQRLEMHGDIAIVQARSSGKNRGKPYEIWYLRVYNKRAGEWKLISHKTVRGPQDPTNPT